MTLLADFVSLFYPQVCQACDGELVKGEEFICINCLLSLPYTGFERQTPNPAEMVFWGRAEIQAAAAFLFFRPEGKTQQLMHRIKYKGEKELAEYIGKLFGQRIEASRRFEGLEGIVPVPLHPAKLRKRGFNQSEHFANGLADKLQLPIITQSLIKTTATGSQTRKSRWQRWQNVEEIFALKNPQAIQGRHLLLVDDIVTTGATLEACAHTLQQAGCRVSIATMAITQ